MMILEIGILAAVSVWFLFALLRMRKDRKSGRGCGGDCARCSGCTGKGEKP